MEVVRRSSSRECVEAVEPFERIDPIDAIEPIEPMRYRFFTCDVFTSTRFGGNPLAVIPDARGLTDSQMAKITREFNYSESTFVLPPEQGHTRRVRIFTPAQEVPFAGHPNVGTAFVLATTGALGPLDATDGEHSITFEEGAGLVPITIRASNGVVTSCELKAPQRLEIGAWVAPGMIASALSLELDDIVTTTHEPRLVSAGLPFVIAELRNRAALERPRIDTNGFEAIREQLQAPIRASVFVYVRSNGGHDDVGGVDLRARMFAPLSGVPEDPATGSAGCAVAGLLAHHSSEANGEFRWRIAQGVEMGRPSVLEARVRKSGGAVESIWIGGACVLVSEGEIEV